MGSGVSNLKSWPSAFLRRSESSDTPPSEELVFVKGCAHLLNEANSRDYKTFSAIDSEFLLSSDVKSSPYQSREVLLSKRNEEEKNADPDEKYNKPSKIDSCQIPGESDFSYVEILGTGGFGVVVKVRKKTTGAIYALKMQPKSRISTAAKTADIQKRRKSLQQVERSIMAEFCNMPFIVSLHYAFTTKKYTALVMEYVEAGSLETMVKSTRSGLDAEVVAQFAVEIALALHHMHTKGIIYRDLKPANVLLSKAGHVKLCDFGLAGRFKKPHARYFSSPQNELHGMPTESFVKSPLPVIDPAILAEFMESKAPQIFPISPARLQQDTRKSEEKETTGDSNENEKKEQDKTIGDSKTRVKEEATKGKGKLESITSSVSSVSKMEESNEDIFFTIESLPYDSRSFRRGRQSGENSSFTRRTTCGTAGYRAPEQVKERNIKYNERGGYCETSDWFGLGATCYVLLFGKKPFLSKTDVNQAISSGMYENLTRDEDCTSFVIPTTALNDLEMKALMLAVPYPASTDPNIKNFLDSLMRRDSTKRLNFEGIKRHSFVSDFPFDAREMAVRDPHPKIRHYVREKMKESADIKLVSEKRDKRVHDQRCDNLQEVIEQLMTNLCKIKDKKLIRRIKKMWLEDSDDRSKVELCSKWDFISAMAMNLEKKAAINSDILKVYDRASNEISETSITLRDC